MKLSIKRILKEQAGYKNVEIMSRAVCGRGTSSLQTVGVYKGNYTIDEVQSIEEVSLELAQETRDRIREVGEEGLWQEIEILLITQSRPNGIVIARYKI